jgi:hypothetical protein
MSATGVQPLQRLDQAADHADFSLVLGGPLYQAFRRARLSGDTLELLHRRIVAIVLFAWLPLAILALVAPPSVPIPIPFLRDCDALARFLVALPLLVWAELIVHERTVGVARNFLTRGIIRPEDVPRLQASIRSATRVRNSVAIELGLLIFAFTVGHWIWRTQVALTTSTWYAVVDSAGWRLTPAGYWYAFVAIPTFQFILGRWYLRMGIWAWLLWRTSRLPLRLTCTHPDRTAGMAFLGKSSYAFAPILFAQGALLSGLIANQVLYEGADLLTFKIEAFALIVLFMIVVLGPLLVFTPQLLEAKHKALGTYGHFANDYVRSFEDKWVRGHGEGSELLGAADIQSLADLANSYDVIREMRIVPFGAHDITRLAAATAAPLLPLALTVLSPEEALGRVLKILF